MSIEVNQCQYFTDLIKIKYHNFNIRYHKKPPEKTKEIIRNYKKHGECVVMRRVFHQFNKKIFFLKFLKQWKSNET